MVVMHMFKISLRVITVCFMVLLMTVASVSAKSLFNYDEANMVNSAGTGDKKYEREFLDITELDDEKTEAQGKYFYQPLYEYYSESDKNSTPEYVLIYAGQAIGSPAYTYGTYGNYIVSAGGYYVPYTLGLCVYVPQAKQVISLREAYDTDLANIDAVFTDYGLGELFGDANGDRKLNIKDATHIQKCLANIETFDTNDRINGICECNNEEVVYISDFNRDGVRNIKDATAIQKYIAKL